MTKKYMRSLLIMMGLVLIPSAFNNAYAEVEHRWKRPGFEYHHNDRKYDRHRHSSPRPYYDDRVVYVPYPVYHGPPATSYRVVTRGASYGHRVYQYRIGQYMPAYERCRTPRHEIITMLPRARPGTRYVQVDQNIYLISEASRKILDAVVLLSAYR